MRREPSPPVLARVLTQGNAPEVTENNIGEVLGGPQTPREGYQAFDPRAKGRHLPNQKLVGASYSPNLEAQRSGCSVP